MGSLYFLYIEMWITSRSKSERRTNMGKNSSSKKFIINQNFCFWKDPADNKAHVFFLAAEVLRGCCFFFISIALRQLSLSFTLSRVNFTTWAPYLMRSYFPKLETIFSLSLSRWPLEIIRYAQLCACYSLALVCKPFANIYSVKLFGSTHLSTWQSKAET